MHLFLDIIAFSLNALDQPGFPRVEALVPVHQEGVAAPLPDRGHDLVVGGEDLTSQRRLERREEPEIVGAKSGL